MENANKDFGKYWSAIITREYLRFSHHFKGVGGGFQKFLFFDYSNGTGKKITPVFILAKTFKILGLYIRFCTTIDKNYVQFYEKSAENG